MFNKLFEPDKERSLINPATFMGTANDPGGASSIKRGFSFFLGNANICGRKFPAALTHVSAVTSTSRSADVKVPTCFLPRRPRTFEDLFATDKMAVSSAL
ncbi:hypothetical protein AVEN_200744-1 [Araneus ventricosus]|uniref:Uncharacterized protein n=1 Tax=Araneus ventricosus TaxID=182803 RepID=A0A4Y2P1C3_ARAVE|nr:hypothetical protein AVEN_200744-1 [Araneus ventricosus]